MVSSPATRIPLVLALIFSVAFGPFAAARNVCGAFASRGGAACQNRCCADRACCSAKGTQSRAAQQAPPQRVALELTATLAPRLSCITLTPPRVDGTCGVSPHSQRGRAPATLAVLCIRLI